MRSLILPPIDAYTALAPSYRNYAEARQLYRRAIDDIVVSRARAADAKTLLDVGAGDGARALEIGRLLGIDRVVLVEPSSGMRSRCPEGVEIWPFGMEEIPDGAGPFDIITCLWNVLGHVQGASHRANGLSRLRGLLAPKGIIFLDVAHRYNAASYGWGKTIARVIHDTLVHSETNGDVTVSWQAGETTVHTHGHVFTPTEMDDLFHSAGLRALQRWTIRYDTGAICRLSFSGHLLYQLAST